MPALLIPIQAFPHTLPLEALATKSLLLLDAVPSLWPLRVPGLPTAQDDRLAYLRRLSGSHSLSTSTGGCKQIQIHHLQKHRGLGSCCPQQPLPQNITMPVMVVTPVMQAAYPDCMHRAVAEILEACAMQLDCSRRLETM